jgi:hypothetical protein
MQSQNEPSAMKVAIEICEEFAEHWEQQARSGDNTGASDHRADAARQIIAELRNVNTAPPAQTALTDDARWIDASKDVPGDEREVIVFLNGHCGLLDDEARKGGGWGIRLGWYDHDKRAWYVHGQKEHFVTHWQDEPSSPRTAAQSASASEGK